MFICCMTIANGLRWGVALVGFYPTEHCSPHHGTPLQVQGMCREMTLTRGILRRKPDCGFDLYFIKHVLECLILIYVLYKSDVI